jgi:GNAT superfamily N-acetyltransferase
MEFIDVAPGHPLWDAVWRLYIESFPPHERRQAPSHARASADPRFRSVAAVERKASGEDGELLALLFWWQGPGFVFVEHIAVNPAIRGRNIGSQVLQWLIDNSGADKVILEIDPPVDEVSCKRLHFYERLGFVADPTPYFHNSYAEGGQRHPLVLLCRPALLTRPEFEVFIGYILGVVLAYKDPQPE